MDQTPQTQSKTRIILGSTSPHKIGAVVDAFDALAVPIEIDPRRAPSDIDEQPEGLEMTMQGATNRAENTLRLLRGFGAMLPSNAFALGIESGVQLVAGRCHDFAAIVFMRRPGVVAAAALSATYEFPRWAYDIAKARGFDKHTVAQAFVAYHGGDATNIISMLSGGTLSRRNLTAAAIVTAWRQLTAPPFLPPSLAAAP